MITIHDLELLEYKAMAVRESGERGSSLFFEDQFLFLLREMKTLLFMLDLKNKQAEALQQRLSLMEEREKQIRYNLRLSETYQIFPDQKT